jgi:hypothetical protein
MYFFFKKKIKKKKERERKKTKEKEKSGFELVCAGQTVWRKVGKRKCRRGSTRMNLRDLRLDSAAHCQEPGYFLNSSPAGLVGRRPGT